MIAPATPPKPQQNLNQSSITRRKKTVTNDSLAHPRMAYARPSLLGSDIIATVPRPTPTAPAKTPCNSLIVIACGRVVEVPKITQVRELPNSDTNRTARVPCFSAAVA